MKNLSKRNLILLSGVLVLALIIVIFITIKPKSVDKGYIEGYKIYLSGGENKVDLLNLYLEEEYPLKGIFKSINLQRRKEIYDRIIKEVDKKIEEEETETKLANNTLKDGLEIIKVNVKDKFEGVIFTEFTAKNNNNYDIKDIIYKISFYNNGKLVDTKKYIWDGKFDKGAENKMTTAPPSGKDYTEAKVEIVSFNK